ncbi:MAG: SLC13 family permease [Chloroflexota bacterium]
MPTPFTTPELLVIGIIIGLFVLIFGTRLQIEIIAVIVLLSVTLTGLVSPETAISGFGSSVVLTLIGLFIITFALERTGVVQWIANQMNNVGGGSELKLITLFMVVGALLSLIMNNVAAGAVLLPAAVRVARESDVPVSKLLMPMSFGTLVGGMATYLTTANILMSELLIARDFQGLNMLDFLPVGAIVVLAGVVYMLLFGRHLLPTTDTDDNPNRQTDLEAMYSLRNVQWHIKVNTNSALAHTSIKSCAINAKLGLTIAAIWRKNQTITIPKSDQIILPDDELLVIGQEDRIQQLLTWGNTLIKREDILPRRKEIPIEPIEIMIAPRSNAEGQTLSDVTLNRDLGLLALALWRDGYSFTTDVRKIPLEVGDAVLVIGESDDIQALANHPDYILPTGAYANRAMNTAKAPLAVLITAVVLSLGIFNIVSLPIAMLAGAVSMVVFGAITMEQFYEAISWRVIFLVAGMLPLSFAITDSGLAERVGGVFVSFLAESNPIFLVAGMIILTMLVVQIIGGQVSALLVGPIAINAALQVGIDPRAMAIAVAMSCSMAFLTPIAHPVNILMMGPGNYAFGDFTRVGIGMTIVTMIAMLIGLMLILGI